MRTPPVLLLVFRRPETTAKVMAAIRAARPERLYVAADGPRPGRPEEAQRCAEARRVATAVDWPCEVKTLFREENLRGPRAVSGAISWFFDHEEAGVILEDDCVPAPDFFRFTAELLDHFQDEQQVMAICGSCYAHPGQGFKASYYASYYADIWGWATWRRAWAYYEDGISRWGQLSPVAKTEFLNRSGKKPPEVIHYWKTMFDEIFAGIRDHWDYRWMCAVMAANGAAVYPAGNLVSNLGFLPDASNTIVAHAEEAGPAANLPHEPLRLPLCHPAKLTRSHALDREIERTRLMINRVSRRRPWKRRAKTLKKHLLGALDYYRRPEIGDEWGGPFNGQPARRALFGSLVDEFRPRAIVETGTYRAATTELLASFGPPVFSVEGNARSYGFSRARLRKRVNVTLLHSDSRKALRTWLLDELREAAQGTVLFYLDAHWNDDLPVSEEIDIVFYACPDAIVMVDDFEVPHDSGYGYDEYGPGKTLNAALIAPLVAAHDLCVLYPSTPANKEGGQKRGCILLAKEDRHGDALREMRFLRA